MNINVNIERLILDGVSIPQAQRPVLQAAVEAELGRLLAANGLAPSLMGGGAVPSISVSSMQLPSHSNYTVMGQQIAQAVYRGIGS
ncbi:hypothetical protein [Calothrix sp. PCC 7507]|uniref:hypothetical protein n=1 Tax=Calothrix sp. PCC 7507 TaxID=99598 RepID=UPI00029EC569|nr:hypothetical protein [Calothrix sp. PCC 7507]AFY34118.1 hypothetical protein Cal7507_3727 [Calothrix sp. PCC 7507]